MARRGNNIYKRKDGRWEGRLYFTDTKKYRSVYGKTYSEAKEKLVKLQNENVLPDKKCIESYVDVMTKWLESSKNRIKESSYFCYQTKIKVHIIPYFKKIKYCKVDLQIMNRFIQDKINEKLSNKYISDMIVMMKTAAKWAENIYGYRNRIINVQAPKVRRKDSVLLSGDEDKKLQRYLLDNMDNTSLGIYLTVFTGLRIGELCGLKWSDIDIEDSVLHVRRTVQRISASDKKSKTAVILSTPKTVNAVRDIPLPEFLSEILKKNRGRETCFVLSGSDRIVEPRCMTNRFKKHLKKAGVSSVNFHSLRHLFATRCLQSNFDIKTLSEILGHANAETTLHIYAHSSMDRKKSCMSLLVPAV